ncbi:hypothetical protein OH492_12920 [Vibrio chagasii]|nr:hypothetical protein [Vibrio chagasii]
MGEIGQKHQAMRIGVLHGSTQRQRINVSLASRNAKSAFIAETVCQNAMTSRKCTA